jgi:DNA-binding transcriptional MerR regulator
MKNYSVKQLSELAGVSVRTLHLYDENGLLNPCMRTEAGYRMYGEKELLRLQQILFYKELDFPLQEIKEILDEPDFDIMKALNNHKKALLQKSERILVLLNTVDKTIYQLKQKSMLKHKDLYEGLSTEKLRAWRKEAIEKYGIEKVEQSENALRSMKKPDFEKLKAEQKEIHEKLFMLLHENPESDIVQEQIAKHYQNIRLFWGTSDYADTQKEQYKGLGQLYVADERFSLIEGKTQPDFALFKSKAMSFFADKKL